MDIIVGKLSGFCDGVRFTIDKAKQLLEKYKKIYCIGEIVHNERVIEDLKKMGLIVVKDIDEIPSHSKMIIRAHGEVKDVYDKAKKKEIEVFDLTCGKVRAVRLKVGKKKDDCFIVIIGKCNHPETQGVQSFAGKDSFILEKKEEIPGFIDFYHKSSMNKIYIVSQTTFNENAFDELVDLLKSKMKDEIIVDKTICKATSNRQEEVDALSKEMDTMIIIGGKNSSNTKELEVISKKNCEHTILIQDYHDLENIKFQKNQRIGIMAGASTPEIVVNEVIDFIKNT